MIQRARQRDRAKENLWRQIIERQKASGKSQKKFCGDEGLNWHSFSSWIRVLQDRDTEERKRALLKKATVNEQSEYFVPLVVADVAKPDKPTSKTDAVAEIECHGLTLRILRGVDSISLCSIFQAMRELLS